MTYTEQYNQYVKECIKERPAFGGPYEDYYLEFDEWLDNYIVEFAERWGGGKVSKITLKEFKKEKGL